MSTPTDFTQVLEAAHRHADNAWTHVQSNGGQRAGMEAEYERGWAATYASSATQMFINATDRGGAEWLTGGALKLSELWAAIATCLAADPVVARITFGDHGSACRDRAHAEQAATALGLELLAPGRDALRWQVQLPHAARAALATNGAYRAAAAGFTVTVDR